MPITVHFLTVDCPDGGAADEMWVLPVNGLQLLAHLEVVPLGRGRLGLEAAGVGELGVGQGLHQEPLPGGGVQGEAHWK